MPAPATRTIEIERHQRFSEPRRERYLRLGLLNGPSVVGDQKTILIVDLNDDTAPRGAGACLGGRFMRFPNPQFPSKSDLTGADFSTWHGRPIAFRPR